MSRSFRRRSYIGYFGCDKSDKKWKRSWHRKMRAMSRMAISRFDADTIFLPHQCEVDTIWASNRECKWRFDPRQHPEWMRK